MMSKKSEKANLEKKRWTFALIGVIFALAILYVGFELFATKTGKAETYDLGYGESVFDPVPPITDPVNKQVVNPPKAYTFSISSKLIDERFHIDDLFPDIDDPVYDIPSDSVEIVTGSVEDLPELPDILPEFPGGFAKMYEHLKDNLKYPEDAVKASISGKVVLQFIVERDGNISSITPLYTLFPSCDAEAIRVIKSMPKWTPGSVKGRPVRAYYTIPIAFILQ